MEQQDTVVEVETRDTRGTSAARRMRRAGRVPAVVYGLDGESFALSVEERRIQEILHLESGRNTILTLSLSGQDRKRAVMIKDLQRDPVTEQLVHVDFVRLDLEREITVTVGIRLIGTPEGVKNEGGILDFIHRTVQVECLPTLIPEHLDVDISGLHINQHITVADLSVGQGVRVLDDPGTVLAGVVPPRVEAEVEAEVEEAAPVAEGEEGEPEVIKKGKEAGEEEAAKEGE